MLVRELLESIYTMKPTDVRLQVRVQYVPFRYHGVPHEESEYFKNRGVDVDKFGESPSNQQGEIPVAYAGIVNRKNQDLLDALKERGRSLPPGELQKMLNDAVISIADIGEVDRLRHTEGIDEIRDALTSPNAVLVVTPSTKGLATKLAKTFASFLRIEVLDLFKTNPKESLSGYKYTNARGYEPARAHLKTGGQEYTQRLAALQQDTEKQISHWRQMLVRTRSPEAAKQIQDKIKSLSVEFAQKRADLAHGIHAGEAKRQNTGSGEVRRLINRFVPTSDVSKLNGKNIIIVDDNVDTGGTIARLVTAILKADVQPKSICAVALHKLT